MVYVNYGMPDDYEALARRGIDVRGKIVIARYGGGWRGLKPKLAQEHGAVGSLIYSDPRDDGYARRRAYPKGGSRPPTGVQRGSVVDMPMYPGDPMTPGIGSTPGRASVCAREDAQTILKIPVLPISYGDAGPLLAALGGDVVPPAWRGALPAHLSLGPGAGARASDGASPTGATRRSTMSSAMIRGSEQPDAWVIRGNHHDAWVFGAWDPLSGHRRDAE